MLSTYPFSGAMDLDSPDLVIQQGFHRTARNGIFRGPQGRMRFESCLGTSLILNEFLPGNGVNLTIGVHYDAVNQRVFFFNFNSAGTHGIYIYYTLTKIFQRLIEDGVNTDGDVLNFTATGRISSIDLLYGDGASGDLLFFVDSLKRCRKINVNHLLDGTYTIIKSAYLDVIKAPPIPPPSCTYENDTTVSANNLINSLFNFCCTYIYDDFEQSVLGSGARQPLPSDPFDPQNNTDKSRNSRISIYIPTGDQNVKKLRIYGKQTKDGATTDWFIVDTLIKSDLGIADNTVYRYLFYNNGNYIPADLSFTTLDYDSVPLSANAQALLNGNVISYGGITEGYNFINPSFNIATSNASAPAYALNGVLFFAATNGLFSSGQPQLTIYLTGVGINDGFGNPTDLEKGPALLSVRAKSGNTDISFSYNNGGNRNIATLLFNLRGAATSAGWIFVSSDTNSLTVYYPTGNVVLQDAYLSGISSDVSLYKSPICCSYPESAYSYGVVYRDAAGRTNGVISNVTGNIKTQSAGTSGQIPVITIGLAGFQPPPWAVYYEIVRTDTLTYQKYLDWVSDSAYQGTGQGISTQYAYFGINNIQLYNTSISATEGVISYAFSPGDRIKVLGRFSADGTFTALNLDYAVLGVTPNPVVNGVVKEGNFVQIYYPTADINANFMFDGSTDFQNYQVLLYSYKSYAATNQNVYFQIGQQYGVGNPGTNSAYHMGNIADNTVAISDGDIFYRQRTVPIQNSYFINTGSYDQMTPYSTEFVNPGGSVIVDNGIWRIVGGAHLAAGLLNTQYPSFVNNDYTILNESAQPLTVRLRGSQSIVDKQDPNGQFAKYIKIAAPGNIITIIPLLALQTGLQPGISNIFVFDTTVTLPPGAKLWIVNYAVNEMLVGGYLLELDVIRSRTINVFDASFSDIYNLKTNSDNKPNVVNVEAAQTYFSTLFRYSQPDQLGTDINNSNRFYPNNFDEFDKSYGDIIRLRVRQREMRVFQMRRCGRVGVYQKFITNESSNTSLVVSDTIITPNNIQYFEGEWGIGNQPDSLCSSGYDDYFVDPVKGYFCRLSLNGIIPISELYKTQTFSGNNLPVYLNQYNYIWGGNSVILGCYNFLKDRDSEALFCMQGGIQGGTTIPGQTLAFIERTNAFSSFYDFAPDSLICAENQLYSFWNGNLYSHGNSAKPCFFYNGQYSPSITAIYKEPTLEKKTFLALTEVANNAWICPSIYTNTFSYGTTPQQSNLVGEDFILLGTDWNASFWNDINSIGSLLDGDPLQANLIVIEFRPDDPSVFSYLSDVSIRLTDSPVTAK